MNRTLKKLLIAAALGLVLIVATAAGVVHFYLDHIVRSAAERIVPPMIQAPFRLSSVSLSPFSGRGTLKGVEIGSPAGFRAPYFAKIRRLHVDVDLRSLLSDTIVVRRIEVDSPELYYEAGIAGTNVGKIERAVDSATGPGAKSAPPPAKHAGKAPAASKKIIIDHLVIAKARAHLFIPALAGDTVVEMADLKVSGIGRKSGGATAQEAIVQVLRPLAVALSQAGGAGDIQRTVKKAAGTVQQTIKSLFGH